MTVRIPMSVLGGFLGAGKTTLVNRVLSGRHGVRYAVLVNDFGAVAVDGSLVSAHDGETVTFANGCVCCAMGDELVGTLDRLLDGDRPPEHVLVEASGVADPRAIADVATLHPGLSRDLVVVLADVETVLCALRGPSASGHPEASARGGRPCRAQQVRPGIGGSDKRNRILGT